VIYVRTWKKLFEQLSDFCRSNSAYSRPVMNAIARIPVRGKLWVAYYQEIVRSPGGEWLSVKNKVEEIWPESIVFVCLWCNASVYSTIRNVDTKKTELKLSNRLECQVKNTLRHMWLLVFVCYIPSNTSQSKWCHLTSYWLKHDVNSVNMTSNWYHFDCVCSLGCYML